MRNFPDSFADDVTVLGPIMDKRGNKALAKLNEKGFVVATGLTKRFAGEIAVMGQQTSIREYCPKDATPSRFGTLESTEKWLTKGGGRAMFMLLGRTAASNENSELRLAGYGWTGHEPCEQLPGYPITSAYRIGEADQGKGLGKPFVQVVVSGTRALFSDEGIGLETWESNKAAGLYPGVGFVEQELPERIVELRPTLDPEAVDGKVEDVRKYMYYPEELFLAE